MTGSRPVTSADTVAWIESTKEHRRRRAFSEQVRRQFLTQAMPSVVASTSDESPSEPTEDAIQDSSWIPDLEAGWDDESALPCRKAWERAVEFLRRHAATVRQQTGESLAAPDLTPVADGSVDLHWVNGSRELLVNVPADRRSPAAFYGDDFGDLKIKGTIDPDSTNERLLLWLTTLQQSNGRSSRSLTVPICISDSTVCG